MFSKSENIFAAYKKQLEEKSTSQVQQKLMGMAYAYKKGDLEDASDEVKDLAKGMTLKQLKDFAATKHDGLPYRKGEEVEEAQGPCWDGYKKVPGKDDYEKGSCVKEENIGDTCSCCGNEITKDGCGCGPDCPHCHGHGHVEEKNKGLWANIHAKRKRGEPPAKPGEKGYPKTLDIESMKESFIKEETATPVTTSLKKLLADHYVMYFKAQSFHWNVKGPNFSQYHDFFGKIYEDVYAQVDVIAEEMRSADDYAPFNFETLIRDSGIREESALVTDVNTMLARLREANDTVIASLEEVFALAEASNNQGLIDYIGARLDMHAKHGWMLKSSMNESVDLGEAGYMDAPKTKAEVDAKDYDEPEGDSRDVQNVAYEDVKSALKELKIKKLDKDTMDMLKSLDPDEQRMIIQGLPSSLRRKAMKELGLKEKVDGRTKGYKETVARLTAMKEAITEGAVASATVRKEIAKSGGKNIKQDKTSISFEMDGKKHSVPLYKNFVADKDYMALQDKLNEEAEGGEEKKSGKTFKISFENINRPNEKKILSFLAQHEKQGNIDLIAQEEKGLTFKVVDEDAVRGMHIELRKFKVYAQECSVTED